MREVIEDRLTAEKDVLKRLDETVLTLYDIPEKHYKEILEA